MSSTSSATSPEDAGENAVKETTEGATRPFPASGDTRPLTMPLPTSDGVATDVLSTGEAPDGTDQTGRLADAETEAMTPTDVLSSPASSSASSRDGFFTAFDSTPIGQDSTTGEDHSPPTDSAPAASASGPVWSAGTVTGEEKQPQAPGDIKGSTLLWGTFLLLVGGLLISAGLGLRFDFTTTAIVCLAGLGVLLVVVALIPMGRRSIKP